MDIAIPADCGNSPRMALVADIVSNWARRDSDAVAKWLADGATWTFTGAATHTGPDLVAAALPSLMAERAELLSVVNHGKFAACDGYLEFDGTRVSFAHMFRFTGAAKTAKVVEVRSYLIEAQSS